MSGRLLLVLMVLGVAGFYLFRRWQRRTPPGQVRSTLLRWGLFGAAILLVGLAVTGRLHWLFALIGGALPFAQRAITVWRTVDFFRRQTARVKPSADKQTSAVATATLRMQLDHDRGEIDGEILRGQWRGRRLSELSLQQLVALTDECRVEDPDSVVLLETFLDRVHGVDWREHQQRAGQPSSGPMTAAEAYRILGLDEAASEADIIAAHRRLQQRLHPDRGGSDFLAAQINTAKAVLLKERAA